MKVLHVIPSLSFSRGGPTKAVLDMVKALSNLGIECEILATNDGFEDDENIRFFESLSFHGAKVTFVKKSFSWLPLLSEFSYAPSAIGWFRKNISNYDLIHVHALFSFLPTVAMLFSRKQKINYILRPLGLLHSYSLNLSKWRKRIYLWLVESKNLLEARFIHFTSSYEREDCSFEISHDRSFTLPLGIERSEEFVLSKKDARQKISLQDSQPVLLFLSRWHPKKGIDLLLDAFSEFKKNGFDSAVLVLAGDGDSSYRNKVFAKIRDLDLQSSVMLPGFLNQELKNIYIRASDIFVLPSFSENFAISAAEALSLGCPVVLSNNVGISDMVKAYNSGWVIDVNSSKLTKSFSEAFETSGEIEKRGENGKRLCRERLDWSLIAEALIDYYKTALRD